MKYRITTNFETLYTHERETKIEYANTFEEALRCYITRIENPETVFCAIDIPNKDNKIVAAFNATALK